MNEVLSKSIKYLSSRQLAAIFEHNRLEVPGFRFNGPMNKTKEKKMRSTLAHRSNLEKLFKVAIDKYKTEYTPDYTWALVSELSPEKALEKAEEMGMGEVVFALVDTNKPNLIATLVNENEETTVSSKSSNEDSADEVITTLRNSLKKIEGENQTLAIQSQKDKEANAKLSKTNADLKTTNAELKNTLKTINEEKRDLTNKYNKLLKENEDLTQKNELLEKTRITITKENDSLKVENEELSKQLAEKSTDLALITKCAESKMFIYGSRFYKPFVEKLISTLRNIEYNYIDDIDLVTDYAAYRKMIILGFTLNKEELRKLNDNEAFQYFNGLYDVIGVNSKEQLESYFKRVRELL